MFCPSNWQKWELWAELNTFYFVGKQFRERMANEDFL